MTLRELSPFQQRVGFPFHYNAEKRHGGAFYETIIFDSFVKSRISPPLVGGDKGEGDITS